MLPKEIDISKVLYSLKLFDERLKKESKMSNF